MRVVVLPEDGPHSIVMEAHRELAHAGDLGSGVGLGTCALMAVLCRVFGEPAKGPAGLWTHLQRRRCLGRAERLCAAGGGRVGHWGHGKV